MRTSLSKKAVLALATALGCLLFMASPASAAESDFTLDDGTITVTGTDPFDLGTGPEGDPCGVWSPPPVITVDISGSATEVTGPMYGSDPAAAVWTSLNDSNNNWYQIDLFVLDDPSVDNTGSISGGVWSQDVYVVAEIYRLGSDPLSVPSDCEKDDLVCIIGAQVALTGSTTAGPPRTATLDGGGSIDVFFCDDATIAAQVTGGSITVDDLELTQV